MPQINKNVLLLNQNRLIYISDQVSRWEYSPPLRYECNMTHI